MSPPKRGISEAALQKLDQARKVADSEPDQALRLASEVLNEDFANSMAIFMAGYCLLKGERFGLAYAMFKAACEMSPQRPEPWNNMGMCHQETWNLKDALRCFEESLKRDPDNKAAINNIGLIHVNNCEPHKAIEWVDRALKIDPTMRDAMDNKGLACLMLGRWRDGWQNWEASLGGKFRKEIRYGEEPRWDGTAGKTIVIYGEQGIGDEISFASCIPDAIAASKKVVLDCDHRLAGLFRRSFPQADVYGTRFEDSIAWPPKYQIEASMAIGSLPKLYRNEDSDFPGTPYLVADPERRIQWKALLDAYGKKPKIGIAWTGGKASTGSAKRSLSLESFRPLIEAVDATWVSLQYKDPTAEIAASGLPVLHWKRATETDDYDDTAALVAELDLCIVVTTAIVHISGAMGKECWCIAPSKPRWFYQLEGDKLPWYKSLTMFRQDKDGQWPIESVKRMLQLRYGGTR